MYLVVYLAAVGLAADRDPLVEAHQLHHAPVKGLHLVIDKPADENTTKDRKKGRSSDIWESKESFSRVCRPHLKMCVLNTHASGTKRIGALSRPVLASCTLMPQPFADTQR